MSYALFSCPGDQSMQAAINLCVPMPIYLIGYVASLLRHLGD